MNKLHSDKANPITRFTITMVTALCGGLVFLLSNVPIPWLLGSMTALLIGSRFIKTQFYCPSYIRDTGLIIVGYSIGRSFTKTAALQILDKLPSMLLMTLAIILFCSGIAFIVSKLSGINYPTILIGSIPGGLSQMILFAEELNDIDITTVTFLQATRLMMIIFFVPFLIFNPLFGQEKVHITTEMMNRVLPRWDHLFPNIILFAVVSVGCAIIGKKLKFPTPFLLVPILGTALLNMSGFNGSALPPVFLDLSQFLIGSHIGLMLKPRKLKHKTKMITLALFSGLLLIAGSWSLSLLLSRQYHYPHATSFLSLAPGGMDQMAILAHEVNADLSVVTGFQLFRMFFIFFAVPPILKMFFKLSSRQKTKSM